MDIDFTSIFQQEVAGQIQRITDLALVLEQNEATQANDEVLNGLMREFHTIKGAARAINYNDIKDVAHAIEDIYHAILHQEAEVKLPELTDISLHAVDLIKGLLQARISGKSFTGHELLPQQAQDYLVGKTLKLTKASTITSVAAEQVLTTEQDSTTKQQAAKTESISTPAASTGNNQASTASNGNSQEATLANSSEYELLTDSLMSLSGELAIAVESFSSQRPLMSSFFQQIAILQREMTLLLNNMAEPLNYAGLSDYTVRLEQFNQNLHRLDKHQKAMHNYFEHADNRFQFLSGDLNDQVHHARMMPLSVLFEAYPRMVRDLASELKKEVTFSCSGESARLDRGILDIIRNPIIHILRNAVDHGIETMEERQKLAKPARGSISIEAQALGSQVNIIIKDDGRGLDLDKIKQQVIARGDTSEEIWQAQSKYEKLQFLFLPGFTTATTISETSGRGFGMDIVKSEIESVGGRVELDFEKDQGLTVSLHLPLNLSLTRCLMVNAGQHHTFGDQFVAFPLNDIENVHRISTKNIKTIEGRSTITLEGETVNIHQLSDLMSLNSAHKNVNNRQVLLLDKNEQRCALIVDDLVDERDIVMRGFDLRIGKMQNFQAFTMMIDGSVALVADVEDIIHSAYDNAMACDSSALASFGDNQDSEQNLNNVHILVVEDSITVREVERHMLEQAGYQVTTAVDGMDGLNKCRNGEFNIIISDIDMPRLNGIEMIKALRDKGKHKNTPIIVVSYKDREDDRAKAFAAGADHYVTKAAFDSGEMLIQIGEMTS